MKKTSIKNVVARQLLDCKLRPVIEVDVITEDGVIGRGSAPTGSSVGMYEAYILRDNDLSKFFGQTVYKAIDNINNIIAPAIIGMDVMDQKAIDEKMIALDGTKNKSNLGGNAIYSVSVACLRAAANSMNIPVYKYLAKSDIETLPLPTCNFINGGYYKNLSLAFQEFTVVPYKADNMEEAVEICVNTFKKLGEIITKYQGGEPAGIGNYYGWAPPSDDPELVMELLHEAVVSCNYENKVAYALDCASSEMYDKDTKSYLLKGQRVDSSAIISLVKRLTEKYNILYVEDILDENDWDGYIEAVRSINRTIIIGDDFTVTNTERLKKAYELKAVEGFILKPNQVGTISESIEANNFAKEHNMITVPSSRAGGIVGDIIMDLAVGLQVCAVKNGAPRSGERIDQLNFLYRAASENPNAKLYDFSKYIRF